MGVVVSLSPELCIGIKRNKGSDIDVELVQREKTVLLICPLLFVFLG